MCCLVDPDGSQCGCKLLYQTTRRDVAEPALCDSDRFDEDVVVCDRLVTRKRYENALRLLVELIVVIQQRVQRGRVDEDQERAASANSRSCS